MATTPFTQAAPVTATALVPHYGPSYNVYTNYGLIPPATNQPAATQPIANAPVLNQSHEMEQAPFVPPVEIAFEIPVETAPSHHPTPSAPHIDLLDDNVRSGFTPAVTPTAPVWTPTSDVPPAVVAYQERCLVQARERNQRLMESREQDQQLVESQPGALVATTTAPPLTLVVPPSHNPSGSDAVHPNRPAWRQSRGTKTTTGAVSGAVVGGVAFGPAFPVGIVLGGVAGGYAANKLSKTGERRAQRQWERASYQQGVQQSPAVLSNQAALV